MSEQMLCKNYKVLQIKECQFKHKHKDQAPAASTSSKPNLRRRNTIKKAFTAMDVEHSGSLDLDHFLSVCGGGEDAIIAMALFNLLDEDGPSN